MIRHKQEPIHTLTFEGGKNEYSRLLLKVLIAIFYDVTLNYHEGVQDVKKVAAPPFICVL